MKILIAVDGSEFGQRALEYVLTHPIGVTENEKRTLSLIHIVTPPPPRAAQALGSEMVENYYQIEREQALSAARARLKKANVEAAEIVDVGAPGKLIAEHAMRGGFDLLAMGSHGQGAVMGLVLGSTVTKVLAHCKVPMLIVR